jgi:hypothetical protein
VRDDRAWPRASLVTSVLIATIALATGVLVVVYAADGPVRFLLGVLALAVALGFGIGVSVSGMRRWIDGHDVPTRTRLLPLAGLLTVFVIWSFDPLSGGTMMAGLIGGLLCANVWAIRVARRNRALVDRAEREDAEAAARQQSDTTRRRTRSTSRAVSEISHGSPVGQALRTNICVERRRWFAWLIATAVVAGLVAVVTPGAVATPALLILVISFGGVALIWNARRLVGTWLAFRDFAKTATEPRRAFVVLLHDPAPKMFRPLLGIWSEPPVVHGGRLPSPERVYRCDEEQMDLLSYAGGVVVHEAWVDTGPRPRSKPRWVAADAGIALPHRRALLGRWYMGSLIGGERPDPPHELTVPKPHPDLELRDRPTPAPAASWQGCLAVSRSWQGPH